MKNSYLIPVLLFGLICALPSCEADKVSIKYYSEEEYETLTASLNLPDNPFSYSTSFVPDHRTDAVATLGRVLFYDKNLSKDNSVSCASCHKQNLAFADDVPFSQGIEGRSTARNSIALGVFRSFSEYSNDPGTTLFWDGRVDNLHDQMIETIANPNEMGMELHEIKEKIKDLEYYKILTLKAFNTEVLSESLILFSLEGFMNSINSSRSKFDNAARSSFIPEANWDLLTDAENEGKQLFINHCQNCHSNGLEEISSFFNDIRSANNGLDLVYTDKGAGEFDNSPDALAIFKVPSLRNIELSAPYMHDGRFATLEDVIDFYSEGIQGHVNLHPFLKENGHPKRFNFTETEKEALIQFLKTLTDTKMVTEAKWSDPFI